MVEDDRDAVQQACASLKQSFQRFIDAHDEYHVNVENEAEQEASEQWFQTVHDSYVTSMNTAKQWLADQAEPPRDISHTAELSMPLDKQFLSALLLPKVEIEKFSGDPLKYQSFVALFNETVDNKSVDDDAKLSRLLQYTTGAAKDAIRSCALIGGTEGYLQAQKLLQKRFGNTHLITNKIA